MKSRLNMVLRMHKTHWEIAITMDVESLKTKRQQ